MVFGKDQDPRADGADVRWAKPRPAPKDLRVRTLPAGSAIEKDFADKAEELGLVSEGMSRSAQARLWKRLSDSAVALKIKRVHDPEPVALIDDDELLLVHLQREAEFWRARARRDRQVALAHELIADQAEAKLANLVMRLGLDGMSQGSIDDDFDPEAA